MEMKKYKACKKEDIRVGSTVLLLHTGYPVRVVGKDMNYTVTKIGRKKYTLLVIEEKINGKYILLARMRCLNAH